MPTRVEESLRHKRSRSGLIVPLVEDWHREFPNEHWDADDVAFLEDLMTRVSKREGQRGLVKVYSPSALGSCLRQAFLLRHYEELGIPKKFAKKIDTHFYFNNGTWLHLKLQVRFHQLEKQGKLKVYATELYVESKHGDHGGTIDTVLGLDGGNGDEVIAAVDIKGLNQRDFFRVANKDTPHHYQIQLSDYVILCNSRRKIDGMRLPRITHAIILAENKAGPVRGYPAALAEHIIHLPSTKEIVRLRLEELRRHEEENTIPQIECESTSGFQFKGCPFRLHCKAEVTTYEKRKKQRRGSKGVNTDEPKVAIPPKRRLNSPRRASTRRRSGAS